ncbi:hypothetical protein ONE63_010660 [Megalurothrips usitatus]|uniref:ERC protein 2-like n=1 Tax=Megalurothrips usitatus TaxID=439358 RepID=A0AAV7XEM0_9NEOP|nr:hypothetical protein ONE63_010660 [Megalurothrips usitatus]
MSRDPYGPAPVGPIGGGSGSRSPRSARRSGGGLQSPSRTYGSSHGGAAATSSRGSPLGTRKGRRSGNNSPEHGGYGHHHSVSGGVPGGVPGGGGGYYHDELGSPVLMDERGRGLSASAHHRSRSASRPSQHQGVTTRYQSLDRGAMHADMAHDRDFMRDRSLDRGGLGLGPSAHHRDRSLDRAYLEDDLYGGPMSMPLGPSARSARQSPNPHRPTHMGGMDAGGANYLGELQHQNIDLQRDLGCLKKELELTNQKLGSSMNSIKTFWSPELKKERALRKEESAKYSLITDQLRLLQQENQVSVATGVDSALTGG